MTTWAEAMIQHLIRGWPHPGRALDRPAIPLGANPPRSNAEAQDETLLPMASVPLSCSFRGVAMIGLSVASLVHCFEF